ncbi:MAG: hypothetical protein MK135_08900 [Polyangiaceae bacterium]|nr:hypothetical protein [Polyangiaceae bacterium]
MAQSHRVASFLLVFLLSNACTSPALLPPEQPTGKEELQSSESTPEKADASSQVHNRPPPALHHLGQKNQKKAQKMVQVGDLTLQVIRSPGYALPKLSLTSSAPLAPDLRLLLRCWLVEIADSVGMVQQEALVCAPGNSQTTLGFVLPSTDPLALARWMNEMRQLRQGAFYRARTQCIEEKASAPSAPWSTAVTSLANRLSDQQTPVLEKISFEQARCSLTQDLARMQGKLRQPDLAFDKTPESEASSFEAIERCFPKEPPFPSSPRPPTWPLQVRQEMSPRTFLVLMPTLRGKEKVQKVLQLLNQELRPVTVINPSSVSTAGALVLEGEEDDLLHLLETLRSAGLVFPSAKDSSFDQETDVEFLPSLVLPVSDSQSASQAP